MDLFRTQTLIALLVIALPLSAQSNKLKEFYDKLDENKGVTALTFNKNVANFLDFDAEKSESVSHFIEKLKVIELIINNPIKSPLGNDFKPEVLKVLNKRYKQVELDGLPNHIEKSAYLFVSCAGVSCAF